MQKKLPQKFKNRPNELTRFLKKFSKTTALAGGLMLGSWLSPGAALAQSIQNNYDFAASSGTYTPLGATATQMPAVKADTYLSPSTPIGFTFNFDGVDYTNFRVSSDGYISFGTTTTSTGTNNLTAGTAARRPLIAPLWDDLDGKAAGGVSSAAYEVTGTTGSRVFTFEWNNWEWNWDAGDAVISFQVKLYEGSNKIEFHYRPEADAVNAGGASIGIAGVGTGAGNFMSLSDFSASPIASTTTETTNVNAKPASGQVYTFSRVVASPIDIATTGLVAPGGPGCFGPNQTVTVTIKNAGTAPLDFTTTPVTINASGTVGTSTSNFPAVTVNTGTLAPGATQNVTVSTTYNMSTAGTYTFNAAATVAGDGRASNNAMAPATVTLDSRQVPATLALPQVVQFDGFTGSNLATVYPGWTEASGVTPTGTTSNWLSDDFGNVTGGQNGIAARINLDAASDNVWMISPKFAPTAATALRFNLALTAFGNTNAATMGSDDELRIMVSTDCGVTYTPIRTYNANTPISNTGQSELISLAQYAGQDIIVAFYATEGTVNDAEDNDLFIDNIVLGTPATNDLGVTALVNPVAIGCYSNSENVTVTIRNNGTSAINFATNNATVKVNVTGAATAPLTATVNTGTLAAGATQNVSVGTVNMLPAGTYNLEAFTAISGDTDNFNDTLTAARTVAPTFALPQAVSFTGFTGSNLATVFPGWTEANGATPTGTTSGWINDDFANVTGGLNGTAARITLDAASDRVWIMGPKVVPTAATSLRFELALTTSGATTAGTLGSDDEFQVMVSTDCGATFTSLRTYNANTPISNTGQTELISLANYAGQNLIIAFFATEGTVNDAESNDLFIDNLFIGTPATNDLGVTALVNPVAAGCYGNSENVTVTIRNNGASAINFATNNATVKVNVTGAATAPLTATVNTGTLAAGATQNVSVGTVNMLPTGAYNFKAFTAISGDTETQNDTLAIARTVAPVVALPQRVNFTGFTSANLNAIFPGWSEAAGATTPSGTTSGWTNDDFANVTTNPNGTSAKINLDAATDNVWIISPKVAATAVTNLMFDLALTAWNGTTAVTMGSDDELRVMVSTDCGATFTAIRTYNASTTISNTGQAEKISLSSYAGQNIIVALYATEGTVNDAADNDLFIDNLAIVNEYPINVSPIAISGIASGCGLTSTEQICVDVINDGTAAQSNIPVSFRVNNGTVVSEVVAGPIQPGDTLQYCFTGKANLATGGSYNIKVYTGLTGDADVASDTLTTTVVSSNPTFTVTDVTTCGSGPVTLTATTGNNTTINWFTAATGGTPVSTGATYSPTVSATTTFYAEATSGTTEVTGRTSTTAPNGSFGGSGGLKFDAHRSFMLQSVVVYPNSAAGGNLVVNLKNAANTIIATTTFAVPGSTNLTPVTVPLNFNVPAGTGYTLEQSSSVDLVRDFAPATGSYYPITPPSGLLTITDGTIAGYYYFFYSWTVSNSCTSARVPVTATVNAAPATPTVTRAGAVLTSSAATGNQWFLNGTAIQGATGQTYTATASGTYTVVATANGCPSGASAGVAFVTGLAKELAGMNVAIYPNPASGAFSVKLTGYKQDATVTVYNLAGQEIASETITAAQKTKTFNIEGLAAGTYLVKVTSEKGVQVSRLLVQ